MDVKNMLIGYLCIQVCINVDIHEVLLLQKKKGQGINTFIVIPFVILKCP